MRCSFSTGRLAPARRTRMGVAVNHQFAHCLQGGGAKVLDRRLDVQIIGGSETVRSCSIRNMPPILQYLKMPGRSGPIGGSMISDGAVRFARDY
jgi:hypothetical protein